MRNISFMLTEHQVRDQQKTVTRRVGWPSLRRGMLLAGVRKGMGLRRGEKVLRLAVVRIVEARREPLDLMLRDRSYGLQECILEGFGEHPTLSRPENFVPFFCRNHKGCTPDTLVTRIAFEYVVPDLALPSAPWPSSSILMPANTLYH